MYVAGSNSFVLSPSKWIESTNAIGIISKAGSGGGTYAHQDIAFEFASWVSAEFKLYMIVEFKRLKKTKTTRLKLEWNLQRTLAKVSPPIQATSPQHAIKPTLYGKLATKAFHSVSVLVDTK